MASARLSQVVSNIAGFLSGAEPSRPVSPEYCDVDTPTDQSVYLVTYGPYGILPSFDPDCLAAICWLKICGVEVALEGSNEPEMSPNGKLPFLMFASGRCIPEGGIQEYGLQRGGHVDAQASQVVLAASTLLAKAIRPALLATMWLEAPMRNRVTRRNYGRNYPWPINEYLIWRMRRHICAEFISKKVGLVELKADALVALKNLAEFLGHHEYFSGLRPGYVDAVAYGLLAVALVVLPPSHELRTMIETCSSLRSFIGRIRREYFD